jgi:hypothetical protein
MVRAIRCGAVLVLLSGGIARAQIDFTPKESFYEVEGLRVPNVTFRNGAKNVTYSPPGHWQLSGGGKKLSLIPQDKVQAGASIEIQPGKDQLPATAENLQAYTELAQTLVPREASKIEVVEALVCPLRISGRSMIEVTLAYTFFGQQFRMNVLFLPHDTAQVRFQFSARTADFHPLFKSFRTSLYSMQGL